MPEDARKLLPLIEAIGALQADALWLQKLLHERRFTELQDGVTEAEDSIREIRDALLALDN